MIAEFKKILHKISYPESRALYWANVKENPNWGDDLNPWLFEKITGKSPIYCPHQDVQRLLMAGSILEQAGPLDDCWGTGLLEEKPGKLLFLKKAFAVRGKLTAKALENSNIQPPSVFGDPGLLVADYLKADLTKSYEHAIIPHYMDVLDAEKLRSEIKAEVIHVSLPIEEFVARVAKAEIIYSSSLHGLICAESLGVPCVWIRFSDKLTGANFKFHDYLSGTERPWRDVGPIDLRSEKSVSKRSLLKACWPKTNLGSLKQKLLSAFPKNIERTRKI